ncbi:N-acetylmuramoyl-L-alanine amidase [Rhizobium sp. AQ_MP]|nr:N-acetylmuramoyl-L-alanine amidase [Rhizobium sp. AQ_MP]
MALAAGRKPAFWTRIAFAALVVFLGTIFANGALAVSAEAPVDRLVAYSARIAGDDARTRIVLDFDRPPTIETRYIANPDRIIVDLPATAFAFAEDDLKAMGLFSDIRYGSMDATSARLVLTAARPARLAIAKVMPNEADGGYRLVLDAELVPEQDFAALVSRQAWSEPQQASAGTSPVAAATTEEFVIAIDAGHGGIDAGATGVATKTPEKDITLAFSKALYEKLKGQTGIRAVMTRDADKFLSLSERVLIARQKGADLLISLHADTLRQADIRGATVYTISDKASDHMAAQLAERENFSDTIGGVELPKETEPEVGDILLDLTRRETQAFSIAMAEAVVGSFEGQISLINNPHRHAGFRVLQAPDVPSILLELGFLSNKEDEKLLLDPAWRGRVADLLVEAIKRYREPLMANGG